MAARTAPAGYGRGSSTTFTGVWVTIRKPARVTRFTHGHPLALRLAVSARGARPDLT